MAAPNLWAINVDRTQVDNVKDLTPGGLPQSMMALPYYRDDSCFDDGTGSDPGPRVKPGSSNDAAPTAVTSEARKDGWTIATGNGSIGVARRGRA